MPIEQPEIIEVTEVVACAGKERPYGDQRIVLKAGAMAGAAR
jgi:hypothetical protein